jgi:hypothetical protein
MKTAIVIAAVLLSTSCYAKQCSSSWQGNTETKVCVAKNGTRTVKVKVHPSFEQKIAALNAVNGMYHPQPYILPVPQPTQAPVQNAPLNCTSQNIFGTVYTTCR